MRIKISACLFACFTFYFGTAQNADSLLIRKMANDILTNGQAYENLRFLCKKIGARLSGSPQAQKAVEATARMLKEAGADTVFLQPCMVPHWIRGEKEEGYITSGGERTNLNLCAVGNSEGTGAGGITAPVVEVKSFTELEQLGEKGIKGKIVFFNFAMDPTNIHTYISYGQAGGGRRSGASQAAKHGALAVLVRSLASNPDDYPHTGSLVYNDSFPKIPALAISTNNAEWLSSELKKRSTGVTAFVRNTSTMLADVPSFNVVGELRGSDKKNEYITVGGHLDSWDLAEGAQDDGAGCVQSIEVIRAFKASGIKPRCTIRAVMFMNEENGGRGADKYLELAKVNKEKHLFALESDAGGFTPRGFSLEMPADKRAKIENWKQLLFPYGVYYFNPGGSGADIGPLREIGTALAGLSPDSQRYFDVHHAATDVFEVVSRRELHLGAVNMAALIYLVDKYGL